MWPGYMAAAAAAAAVTAAATAGAATEIEALPELQKPFVSAVDSRADKQACNKSSAVCNRK